MAVDSTLISNNGNIMWQVREVKGVFVPRRSLQTLCDFVVMNFLTPHIHDVSVLITFGNSLEKNDLDKLNIS